MEIIIKLKFKKSYLRLTMSQKKKKLSELAKLSFEKEMLEELEYKNLINNFAPQKQENYI